KRVAVVTGSNKGIGLAIVRGLCKEFDGDVLLTARNQSLGLKAVQDLEKEGLCPKFHLLDVTKAETILKLKAFLKETYGGLDVLINNAGIASFISATGNTGDDAETIVRTNFTGLCDVSEALFPLLRPHASCIKLGIHGDHGWPTGKLTAGYGVSKIGVSVMSFIQQRDLQGDPRPDIVVNACCPGYVMTDLTGQNGTKTTDQGAETPLYLAMLPPNTKDPRGQLVSEKQTVDWNSLISLL
ncbi:carbonyl reductase [NADPH] 1-like, partial [Argopecten irradians]|uniref:carbonyl reductase [NADPH] 1-like n=1 Tax=Argopecten irradians TaxID=31199 RepID=UPI00371D3C78